MNKIICKNKIMNFFFELALFPDWHYNCLSVFYGTFQEFNSGNKIINEACKKIQAFIEPGYMEISL